MTWHGSVNRNRVFVISVFTNQNSLQFHWLIKIMLFGISGLVGMLCPTDKAGIRRYENKKPSNLFELKALD